MNKEKVLDENQLIKKVKRQKINRGILITINALLAGYFVFELVSLIRDNASNTEDSPIYTFQGSDESESQRIYDTYLNKNGNEYQISKAYDMAIYGDYLNISKYSFSAGNYSQMQNNCFSLVNVSASSIDFSKVNLEINSQYLNGGIKLSSLDVGDYLIGDGLINAQDKKMNAIKLQANKEIRKSIYTLPDLNNRRKKIEFKTKESSYCSIISVTDEVVLPSSYYDFCLIGETANAFVDKLNALEDYPDFKCYIAKDIQEAYKINSSYCLVLDETYDQVYASNYINYKSCVKDGNLINNQSTIDGEDACPYVRELGGHITKSGSAIKDIEESFYTAPLVNKYDNGKFVLKFSQDKTAREIIDIIKFY